MPVEKVWLSLLWQIFFLWQAESSEVDSNRGSKCFGCLVSTEAHGDDGCQVLLGEALCGRGPRARATAWQHQRGSEICSQSHGGEHEEWAKHADRGFSFWQTSRSPIHTGVFHVAHGPVHGSIDPSVASVVHRFSARLQRESHFAQLGHSGVIKDWSWEWGERKKKTLWKVHFNVLDYCTLAMCNRKKTSRFWCPEHFVYLIF